MKENILNLTEDCWFANWTPIHIGQGDTEEANYFRLVGTNFTNQENLQGLS